jgi:hypothetical protein
VYDINLFQVWVWNYRNHAGFYDEYPRTYWKWLLVNPVEFALAVGPPILVLAAYSFWNAGDGTNRKRCRDWRPWLSCGLVWGLIWLSGKNMGEAARLWIVMMPWLIWLGADGLGDRTTQPPQAAMTMSHGAWFGVLTLQLAICFATVARVSGFHFGGI